MSDQSSVSIGAPSVTHHSGVRPSLASPRPSLLMSTASDEIKNLFHYTQSTSSNQSKKRKAPGTRSSKNNKKKKIKMWNHTFVCLCNPMDCDTPDSMLRAHLQLAGLGGKKIELFLYGGSSELHEELIDSYPKLSSAGGYELLRQGTGRQLEEIPIPPDGYSVEYLKSVVHNAKVYIRPLQTTLNLTATPCNVRYIQILSTKYGLFSLFAEVRPGYGT